MRRVPAHLQLIRGNPSKRPIRREPEPQVPENMPEPPLFLSAYAKDEWWTTGPELHRLGLLTLVDYMSFAAYCQSVGHWRTCTEVLATMGQRDAVTHGLLIKRADGNAAQNPLVRAALAAADKMLKLAGEFGLTPVARSRIGAGPGHEPPGGGKFDGLIG
jgi:P27 family predicted phage terminase small subunit